MLFLKFKDIVLWLVVFSFVSLPAFGWIDESFIPVWEKDYKTKGSSSAEKPSDIALIVGIYRDNGDGTVTDTKTGLQWMRCSLGQTWNGSVCTGVAKIYTWDAAMAAGKSQHFAEKSDWRVPNLEELNTLIYCSSGKRMEWRPMIFGGLCERKGEYRKPTLHADAFPNTPSNWFWSSLPLRNRTDNAWTFNFNNGGASFHYKNNNYHVRLVRNGQ